MLAVVAAAGLATSIAASAQLAPAGDWVSLGPAGGEVRALVADPFLPDALWAATSGGGIYRSTDGGEQWRPAGGDLFASDIVDLAVARSFSRRLYAVTPRGVWRSDDAGETWRRRSIGLPQLGALHALLVHPFDPDRVWLGTSAGVYTTDDAGEHWREASDGFTPRNAFSIAGGPGAGGRLFVGSNSGVWRSDDDGETWIHSSDGLQLSSWVTDLVVDPFVPQTVYAALVRFNEPFRPIFRSTDGGLTWKAASAGLLVSPFEPWVLAADPGIPGSLFAGGANGVFRSTDRAASWIPAASPGSDRAILELLVDPHRPGRLYAGFEPLLQGTFGVLRSDDRGASWQALKAGFAASSITGLVVDDRTPARFAVGTETQGVQWSEDGGATWRPPGPGPELPFTGPLTRDPADARRLFVVAGSNPERYDRIFGSTDGGRAWRTVAELPCCVGAVRVDPFDGDRLYARAFAGVWRSADGGATWTLTEVPSSTLALSVDPSTPGTLWVGATRDSGLPVSPPIFVAQVFRSRDFGETWSLVFEPEYFTRPSDWTFAFDPVSPGTVLAALVDGAGILYRSSDDGESWHEVPFPGGDIRALAFDGRGVGGVPGSRLYAGTRQQGVYVSEGAGDGWRPLGLGLSGANVATLTLDPHRPSTLYAGTAGAGLYRLGPGPCEAAGGLCLAGRFRVTVSFLGADGEPKVAGARPFTDSSGLFWFGRPDNPEVMVKLLDGRPVNGFFWLFYGALSNRAYTLTVVDTLTGAERTYVNPQGTMASVGDTRALPEFVPPPAAGPSRLAIGEPASAERGAPPVGVVAPVIADRFQVEVAWRTPRGRTGTGKALPVSPESVAFWFFNPANPELLVKVLDGRVVNGRFWVFFGSLTNVGFTLTVTDTATGAVRTYENAQGTFGSRADTAAFQ